ncbi:ArnT family glycosyltransferase [Thiohalophilus sp.]|uniref:ArnT family glycosyltransferase n=1 Tax=Thiohalophilus sp. TaxID=3028392 RepID=UPI002ACDC218|nr:glycosyltransferase family 39 protein [Thiohalophilus sp.]MDZ7661176.1 glycosyltransferase family 39 protein [Thiohalophilus sp.]
MMALITTRVRQWSTCLSQADTVCYRNTLLLILLTGLGLRLAAIYFAQGYHHFMVNDEVSALGQVLALLAGDEQAFYLAQPSLNDGKLPGPLWTLFGVLLFKLGGESAQGVLYGMAIINSVTVFFIYLLARRFFTPGLALASAAIYALAPWTVYYSYGLYNPVPLDLIGVLLFLALWQTLNRERSRQVFWVFFFSAVIPQFHMIGVFVFPAILLVLLLSAKPLNWRWLLAGVIAGGLLYLPYLIGDMQNDWQNLRAMAGGGEAGEYSASVLKIITAPATVLSSVPAGWSGDGLTPFKAFGNQWFGHFTVLAVLASWTLLHSFVFLFHIVRRTVATLWQRRGRLKDAMQVDTPVMFVGLLVLIPLLLFLLTGRNFSTRYTIVLFPLLFLLPGLFLQSLRRPAVVKYWSISLVIIGVFNLYLLGSYYVHQQQRFAAAESFMPSFNTLASIRQTLQQEAGVDRAVDVVLSPQLPEELPHFDYKLIATIRQYVQIWREYREPENTAPAVTYMVSLEDKEVTGEEVYSNGGIVIIRANK